MTRKRLTRSTQVIKTSVPLKKKQEIKAFAERYGTKESVIIRLGVDMFMNKVKAKTIPQIIFLSPEAKQEIIKGMVWAMKQEMAKGTEVKE